MSAIRLQRILGDEAGFTLIELLGVAVIVIILSLMALPIYGEVSDYARLAKSRDELRMIEQALEAHKAEKGKYPDNLGTLVTAGYLKNTSFRSPWSDGSDSRYYFYAVDSRGAAQAYVLGDPGPTGNCENNKTKSLSVNAATPLPCGQHPYESARHWRHTTDPALNVGNTGLESLKDYRQPTCDPYNKDTLKALACNLRFES